MGAGDHVDSSALRVLLISYKIRPQTGSEDGSGYHIAAELARRGCDLTLISRVDNVEILREDPAFGQTRLIGVDVPRALGFFKRGGRGTILYYYFWQLVVSARATQLNRDAEFDIVHQLNFHADWAPHFLWRLRKPTVWGPIGHHRFTPRSFFPPGDTIGLAREVIRAAVKRVFWYLDPFLRVAMRRTSAILYANSDLAPPFRKYGAKIVVRPYAGSFAAGPRPLRQGPSVEDVFRVLWVGRFVPMKGLVPAIEAFARFVCDTGPSAPVELVLVGDGPMRDHAFRLINERSIAERTRVLPWISQSELSQLYSSSSVFLYPSIEAQGLVVAEALSFGLPVLAIQGTGPALLTGVAGWTVPHVPLGPLTEALAGGLAEAYRLWHADGLADLRRVARERYVSYLDWPRIVDDVLAAYRRATETASVAGATQ